MLELSGKVTPEHSPYSLPSPMLSHKCFGLFISFPYTRVGQALATKERERERENLPIHTETKTKSSKLL